MKFAKKLLVALMVNLMLTASVLTVQSATFEERLAHPSMQPLVLLADALEQGVVTIELVMAVPVFGTVTMDIDVSIHINQAWMAIGSRLLGDELIGIEFAGLLDEIDFSAIDLGDFSFNDFVFDDADVEEMLATLASYVIWEQFNLRGTYVNRFEITADDMIITLWAEWNPETGEFGIGVEADARHIFEIFGLFIVEEGTFTMTIEDLPMLTISSALTYEHLNVNFIDLNELEDIVGALAVLF